MSKTKRNVIILGSSILIILGVYICIGKDYSIDNDDKKKVESVVNLFVNSLFDEDPSKMNGFLSEQWTETDIKETLIGYDNLKSITVEKAEVDKYNKYCKKYISSNEEFSKDFSKYATVTANLKYDYKEGSKYEDSTIETVFLLGENANGWKIHSFGTTSTFSFLN